jgi:hypothetical protein
MVALGEWYRFSQPSVSIPAASIRPKRISGAGSIPAGAGAAAAATARCALGRLVGRARRCGEREPPTHPLGAAVRARELGLDRRAHRAALLERALATQADVLVSRHRPSRIARGGGAVNPPPACCSPSWPVLSLGRVSTAEGQSLLLTLALRILGWAAGRVQNSDRASEPGFAMSGAVPELHGFGPAPSHRRSLWSVPVSISECLRR